MKGGRSLQEGQEAGISQISVSPFPPDAASRDAAGRVCSWGLGQSVPSRISEGDRRAHPRGPG